MSENQKTKAPEQAIGVVETKEAIDGALALSTLLIRRFRDGVDFGDVVAIFDKLKNDDDFKNTLEQAIVGASKIPEEVKDLDVVEATGLAAHVLLKIPTVIEELKKK